MNAKEQSKAWAIDQFDPDNWLEIPGLGVLPESVNFEGFANPIVRPQSRALSYGLRQIVREHVKTARMLIRKESRTLEQLKVSYLEVLDMMEACPASGKITATHDQAMATFYYGAMSGADRAVRYVDGGWDGVVTSKTNTISLAAITQSAEAIRHMVLQSASTKPVEMLRRQIEEVSTMKRTQASTAGRASGAARRERAKCTADTVLKGYQALMATGTEEKDVAAKLATRHDVSADYIRRLRKIGTQNKQD